jgi:hypothetical protein
MIAQGPVATDNTLSFTGLVSDPFQTYSTATTGSEATFTGTPLADATNLGRFSMLQGNSTPNQLVAVINSLSQNFNLVIYQASGGQLFWLEYDGFSLFTGPIEQQGSLSAIPAARKHPGKTQVKRKH